MKTTPQTFVVLAFDGLQLAMPRADVRAVEAAADIARDRAVLERQPALPGGVGWIASEGALHPVFCFDADLRRQVQPAASRRVCVIFATTGRHGEPVSFGLLCDDFDHLVARDAAWQPLPPALAAPGSPLRGLLVLDGSLACTTDASVLAQVLPLPSVAGAVATEAL